MTTVERPEVYEEIQLPTASVLDETRGRFCYSLADVTDVDPGQHMTLARLSTRLGYLLGPRLFTNAPTNDPLINATTEDVERVSEASLSRGLYIFRDDNRYFNGEQVVTIRDHAVVSAARQSKLKLPFEATYYDQPGVVFGSGDYGKIALNPGALIDRIGARTRHANRGRTNVPENNRRVKSSGGQAMAAYVVASERLQEKYRHEGQLVRSLFKQVRDPRDSGGTPQNQYKVRNLDVACRQFGNLFHELIETAAINNGWTSHDIHAAHKVSVYERYLADTPEEINAGWRRQLGIYGQYNNARLFKLQQSLYKCAVYRDIYRPYIRAVINQQAQAAQAA